MRALIDVPFRDAAATDLAWALEPDAAPSAGLAHVDVVTGAFDLRLHVLGASHAVELLVPGGRRVTETVACGIAGGVALDRAPGRIDAHGLRYAFSADVETAGTAAVVALADELHRTLTEDPAGIVATFPGAPGAATGLRAHATADGAAWDTWHLYPERGEVVRTRSSVALLGHHVAVDPAGTPGTRAAGPAPTGVPGSGHAAPPTVDDRPLTTTGEARR
ncbi:DUF2617 family protein [Patulibacter sp.]|uniref:DUF2617 family protein n=1 Tax=Patulibacter sp. TaxID=1912859 RepID=UPI00271BEBCE|nr:DUF2617 family protein [Patulibacter sp.]MDO9409433.1 DUF2617 family protein [Patulibacter sp.]